MYLISNNGSGWVGDFSTVHKQHDKGSDIMHDTGPLALTHATPPRPGRRAERFQTQLTNREFLTLSRSLGYHSKSIAREEAKAKGSRSGQRWANRKLKKEWSRGIKPVQSWNWGRKCKIVNVLKEWDAMQNRHNHSRNAHRDGGMCRDIRNPTGRPLYVWFAPQLIQTSKIRCK